MKSNAREIMEIAIKEANKGYIENEVPVGAVLLFEDGNIVKGHNKKSKRGFLGHAEIEVLRKSLRLKRIDFKKSILYVTLEPCLMCLGAMLEARIGGLVFGAYEEKFGGVEILKNSWEKGRYPHKFPIIGGFMEEECVSILKQFFHNKRKKYIP